MLDETFLELRGMRGSRLGPVAVERWLVVYAGGGGKEAFEKSALNLQKECREAANKKFFKNSSLSQF